MKFSNLKLPLIVIIGALLLFHFARVAGGKPSIMNDSGLNQGFGEYNYGGYND